MASDMESPHSGPPDSGSSNSGMMQPTHHTPTTMKWILELTIPMIICTTLAVAARIYTRGFKVRTFGWDDWFILPAYAFFVVLCSVSITSTHMSERDERKNPKLAMLELCAAIFYLVSSTCVKLSVGCYFLRIVGKGWERYIIIFTVSVYSLYSVAACVISGLLDTNSSISQNWPTTKPLAYLSLSLNSAADFVFVLVSLPVVFRLRRMPIRNVLGVCLLIMLATITSILSIVRIHYVPPSPDERDIFILKDEIFAVLIYVELGAAIVTACLATLHPLLKGCLGGRKRQSNLPQRRRRKSDTSNPETTLAPIVEVEENTEGRWTSGSSMLNRIGILPTNLSGLTTMSTTNSTFKWPTSTTTTRTISGGPAMEEKSQV